MFYLSLEYIIHTKKRKKLNDTIKVSTINGTLNSKYLDYSYLHRQNSLKENFNLACKVVCIKVFFYCAMFY